MKNVLLALTSILALSGCGSSGSSTACDDGGCTETVTSLSVPGETVYVDVPGETITEISTCTQTILIEPLENGDIFWETVSEGECDGVVDYNGTITKNDIIITTTEYVEVIKEIEVEVIVTESCIQTINYEILEDEIQVPMEAPLYSKVIDESEIPGTENQNGDIRWWTTTTETAEGACDDVENTEGIIKHVENEVVIIKEVIIPCESDITFTVFKDYNRDGDYDSGEYVIDDVEVEIFDGTESVYEGTTDDNGKIQTKLGHGNYTLVVNDGNDVYVSEKGWTLEPITSLSLDVNGDTNKDISMWHS